MKKEFWLERWERGEIGFHQDEINPYLLQYWGELPDSHGGEVFVPLCGRGGWCGCASRVARCWGWS